MAFFGFGELTISKGNVERRGPLSPLLVPSEFNQTTLRYPLDVGNYDKGHYVVFYIKQQKQTSYRGNVASNPEAINESGGSFSAASIPFGGPRASLGSQLLGALNNGLGRINSATGGVLNGITSTISGAAGGVIGGIGNLFGSSNIVLGGNSAATQSIVDTSVKKITGGGGLDFLRTTELTTDAIALYMPDTLAYTYSQSYDQLSLGGELAGQALSGGKAALDAFKEAGGGSDGAMAAGKTIIKTAGLTATKKGFEAAGGLTGSSQTADVAFTALTGKVVNPMLEMIYRSPNFRTFDFEFSFYPRDEKEALEVQRIIERLRFHQAPELAKESQGFLLPPSEFDIRFYYGGQLNPNIPQVATCVLTAISTDYAPNGFSAYEMPGENKPALGRTGMPTAIRLNLSFQETTYLTKRDFREDTVGQKTLRT